MSDQPPRRRFRQGSLGARYNTPSSNRPNAQAQQVNRDPRFFRDPNSAPPSRRWQPTPMGLRGQQDLSRPSIRRRQTEVPYRTYDEAINQLPNSELLTPSERWLYKKLPMVMNKTVAGRPVGDWLESFNDGPFGKILGVFDIGAETLERGHGFLSQWSDAYLYGDEDTKQEFNSNLAEAWYAGSLFADMTNLPGFTHDETGAINGMNIPGHLAGRDGINKARMRISELVDQQGMTASDALKQVRAEYYTDLGALSIRAQMQDSYYHMLLDPINVLMPYIRPVERAQALRTVATTQRLLPGTLDTLSDTARGLQDAAKIAEEAGDTALAAENISAATRILERVDALKDTKEITNLDKFAMFITGGDPLEPPKGFLGSKWNPFGLSPSARTNEMITVVSNNIDNYVLARSNDPYEIMRTIARANKGSLGPEFGHAFLTLEGRTAQATMNAAEAAGKKLLADYVAVQPHMDIVKDAARITGNTIYDVIHHLEGDDAAAFISRLAGMGDEGAELATRMTDDFVGVISDFNKRNMPYSEDLFKWHLSDEIRDITAKMAIAKFGVKEQGLIYKMTGALKTAETLAFLRLNPTFAIKNFVNNEVTNIGRFGLGGFVTNSTIDNFITEIGFRPHRIKQAFTMAGEGFGEPARRVAGRTAEDVVAGVDKASKRIAKTVRGEGMVTRFDDWLKSGSDKLPEWLDMGVLATRAERSASARAFYVGYNQGMRRYFWKPGSGFNRVSDVVEDLPRNIAKGIEEAVQGVKNEGEIRAVLNADNLNLNAKGIANDIVREYGYDLHNRFDAAYIEKLTDNLAEAMPQGTGAVRRVITQAREEIGTKLDDMAQARHQMRIDEAAAVTEMEGPGAFPRIWGDALDDFHGFQIAYDSHMARFVPENLTGEAANIFWNTKKSQQNASWGRAWTRLDDTLEGIKKGAANLLDENKKPLRLPPEVTTNFRSWRKTWDDFYKFRNKQHDNFFSALAEGKQPTKQWAQVQEEINQAYLKAVADESNFTTALDDSMVGWMRQSRPETADAYAAWRQHARELRLKNREDLVNFRQSLIGQDQEYKQAAWSDFWQKVQEPHINLWRTDRAAYAALQGDKRAAQGLEQLNQFSGATQATDIRTIANRYRIFFATEEGVPVNQRIVRTVDKYLRGGYDEAAVPWDDLDEAIKLDFAHNALLDRELPLVSPFGRPYGLQTDMDTVLDGTRRYGVMFHPVDESQVPQGLRLIDVDLDPEIFGEELIQLIVREGDQANISRYSDEIEQALSLSGTERDVAVGRALGYDDAAIESMVRRAEGMQDIPEYKSLADVPDDVLEDAIRLFDEANPPKVVGGAPRTVNRIEDITPELAEEAFEARRVFRGDPELPEEVLPEPQQFDGLIVDSDQVMKEAKAMDAPLDVAEDQHWLANGFQGLDDIEAQAIKRIEQPPLKVSDLTAEQVSEIEKYLRHTEGQFADARMASIKFGEFRRDSALLNYNRRYNYNNWLGAVMPFEFWTTQSLAKWALHSIDRPAMLANFLRLRKFIATAGLPQEGFPSRLKDSFRINMPFLPDWMGGTVFADPLRWSLPFDNWMSAAEMYRRESMTQSGRAERLLLKQVSEGKITQAQADEALEAQSGPLWEQAINEAKINDEEGRTDAWDYASMLLSPHAPLVWGKEALIDGTPENIGAFLPISRTFKQAFGTLGVDTSQAKWNVGGNIRKMMGLPAFDRWDEYRVDRELSNMAAEGYPLDEIKVAMIEQQGPLWDEASSRAAKMFAGGGVIPFLMKTLGIPVQGYPEGEGRQRALQNDFSEAYEQYESGNVQALTNFFDNYPEYETRLGLWDEPEERLHKFMVDNIWNTYHELPSVHKRELREYLGDDFQNFLSTDHKGESFSAETLQSWFRLMGGDPPGTLNSPVQPLEFAPDDVSWQVEQFYNLRGALFPEYRDQQDEYFSLDDKAKKKYRYDHPELVYYWNWRRDFFHRNPQTVPYLDDDFEFEYKSLGDYQAAQSGMPTYTFNEWSYVLGSRSTATVLSSGDIPAGTEDYLEDLADDLGISLEEMIDLVGTSQR